MFLDTVGLLALFDTRDQWHQPAARAWYDLTESGVDFCTTPEVMLECANAAARRPYRKAVADLYHSLDAAGLLLEPSTEERDRAWANYTSGAVGAAGVVDHLSFLVMRRCGISHAFTNDRHFAAAGFQTLF